MKKCLICAISANDDVSLHRFPSDNIVRNKWIALICKLDIKFEYLKDAVICSNHFLESDYDQCRRPYRILKKGSVPSRSLNLNLLSDTENTSNTSVNSGTDQFNTSINKENREETLQSPSSLNLGNARYIGDLKVEYFNSPRKAKRHLSIIRQHVDELRTQKLKRNNTKLLNKINNVEDLLSHFYEQNLLNQERQETLMNSIPDTVKAILERRLAANNAVFTPELRTFALTLHFYSPRAYCYVRSAFKNLLPHPRTIQKWYSVIDRDPGFTNEVFEAMKMRANDSKASTPIVINLVLDEMSIRQKIEFSGSKFHGYVDIGAGSDQNAEPDGTEATNAFVL